MIVYPHSFSGFPNKDVVAENFLHRCKSEVRQRVAHTLKMLSYWQTCPLMTLLNNAVLMSNKPSLCCPPSFPTILISPILESVRTGPTTTGALHALPDVKEVAGLAGHLAPNGHLIPGAADGDGLFHLSWPHIYS